MKTQTMNTNDNNTTDTDNQLRETFTLTITLGHDAMFSGTIMDDNGNTVGYFGIKRHIVGLF